jgi:diacylglycerol kinase family enzyme
VRKEGKKGLVPPHFRKPYLIINPKSGNGRAIKAHIDSLAQKRGIVVLFTSKTEDVETIARRAVHEGADVIGISGGDGSIGAVAKVALESRLPIVVLPGGTRCHFARDLGLDPKHIADALTAYNGVERRVDVGDINGRIFLNNVSFGLYADIVDHPEYREHKVEVSREVLKAVATGKKKLYDLRFTLGKHRYRKAAQVLVGVNRYDTMNLLDLGHRNALDEGMLQVTAITELNENVVKTLMDVVGTEKFSISNTRSQDFSQEVTKQFTISSGSDSLVVGVDGEREVYKSPVHVRVKPKVLKIYVPPEGTRGRPRNLFSVFTIRQVWRAAAR